MVLYHGVFACCGIDPSQDVEGLSHLPQPNSQKDGKKRCMRDCRLVVHRRGQMGSGSQVLNYRLGCLAQKLTVYTVATVNSHLPIALDTQPANLCMRGWI